MCGFMWEGGRFKCLFPDFVMSASVRCICWVFGCWDTGPVCLILLQGPGAACWHCQLVARLSGVGCPLQFGKKSPAPRIVFPKVFTKMICLCLSTTGQRRTNSTTMTMLGHSNKYVANEIGEHRTMWIQTNMWRCSFQLSVYWQQVKG